MRRVSIGVLSLAQQAGHQRALACSSRSGSKTNGSSARTVLPSPSPSPPPMPPTRRESSSGSRVAAQAQVEYSPGCRSSPGLQRTLTDLEFALLVGARRRSTERPVTETPCQSDKQHEEVPCSANDTTTEGNSSTMRVRVQSPQRWLQSLMLYQSQFLNPSAGTVPREVAAVTVQQLLELHQEPQDESVVGLGLGAGVEGREQVPQDNIHLRLAVAVCRGALEMSPASFLAAGHLRSWKKLQASLAERNQWETVLELHSQLRRRRALTGGTENSNANTAGPLELYDAGATALEHCGKWSLAARVLAQMLDVATDPGLLSPSQQRGTGTNEQPKAQAQKLQLQRRYVDNVTRSIVTAGGKWHSMLALLVPTAGKAVVGDNAPPPSSTNPPSTQQQEEQQELVETLSGALNYRPAEFAGRLRALTNGHSANWRQALLHLVTPLVGSWFDSGVTPGEFCRWAPAGSHKRQQLQSQQRRHPHDTIDSSDDHDVQNAKLIEQKRSPEGVGFIAEREYLYRFDYDVEAAREEALLREVADSAEPYGTGGAITGWEQQQQWQLTRKQNALALRLKALLSEALTDPSTVRGDGEDPGVHWEKAIRCLWAAHRATKALQERKSAVGDPADLSSDSSVSTPFSFTEGFLHSLTDPLCFDLLQGTTSSPRRCGSPAAATHIADALTAIAKEKRRASGQLAGGGRGEAWAGAVPQEVLPALSLLSASGRWTEGMALAERHYGVCFGSLLAAVGEVGEGDQHSAKLLSLPPTVTRLLAAAIHRAQCTNETEVQKTGGMTMTPPSMELLSTLGTLLYSMAKNHRDHYSETQKKAVVDVYEQRATPTPTAVTAAPLMLDEHILMALDAEYALTLKAFPRKMKEKLPPADLPRLVKLASWFLSILDDETRHATSSVSGSSGVRLSAPLLKRTIRRLYPKCNRFVLTTLLSTIRRSTPHTAHRSTACSWELLKLLERCAAYGLYTPSAELQRSVVDCLTYEGKWAAALQFVPALWEEEISLGNQSVTSLLTRCKMAAQWEAGLKLFIGHERMRELQIEFSSRYQEQEQQQQSQPDVRLAEGVAQLVALPPVAPSGAWAFALQLVQQQCLSSTPNSSHCSLADPNTNGTVLVAGGNPGGIGTESIASGTRHSPHAEAQTISPLDSLVENTLCVLARTPHLHYTAAPAAGTTTSDGFTVSKGVMLMRQLMAMVTASGCWPTAAMLAHIVDLMAFASVGKGNGQQKEGDDSSSFVAAPSLLADPTYSRLWHDQRLSSSEVCLPDGQKDIFVDAVSDDNKRTTSSSNISPLEEAVLLPTTLHHSRRLPGNTRLALSLLGQELLHGTMTEALCLAVTLCDTVLVSPTFKPTRKNPYALLLDAIVLTQHKHLLLSSRHDGANANTTGTLWQHAIEALLKGVLLSSVVPHAGGGRGGGGQLKFTLISHRAAHAALYAVAAGSGNPNMTRHVMQTLRSPRALPFLLAGLLKTEADDHFPRTHTGSPRPSTEWLVEHHGVIFQPKSGRSSNNTRGLSSCPEVKLAVERMNLLIDPSALPLFGTKKKLNPEGSHFQHRQQDRLPPEEEEERSDSLLQHLLAVASRHAAFNAHRCERKESSSGEATTVAVDAVDELTADDNSPLPPQYSDSLQYDFISARSYVRHHLEGDPSTRTVSSSREEEKKNGDGADDETVGVELKKKKEMDSVELL